MAQNKDIKKLCRQLEDEGWTVTRSKHIKLVSPHGGTVFASSTPSCKYAYNNVLRDVKRIKERGYVK